MIIPAPAFRKFRAADFQSAVSPTFESAGLRRFQTSQHFSRPRAGTPAIQQIESLRHERGAVLLEVVLALVLLAAAAAVIGAGLSASIDRVEHLKLNAHAADLAVSVLSELQMGSKTLSGEGPESFEAPFEGWTWEARAEVTDETVRDTGRTKKVEVIIRHDDPAIVHRLCQVVRLPEKEEDVLRDLGL